VTFTNLAWCHGAPLLLLAAAGVRHPPGRSYPRVLLNVTGLTA